MSSGTQVGFGCASDESWGVARIGAYSDIWAPLGRFLVPFGRPLDFEGGPQIAFLDIEANKMRNNGVLDRVLQKHEFQRTFDAKIQRPDLVKNEFGR